jgi:transposase-like protein
MLKVAENGSGGRGAKRAAGERSAAAAGSAGRDGAHDPELIERPRRRRFTAEYKLRILRQAEACTRPGDVGALLRREGLYSSLLTTWRQQREKGALAALDRPRGRRRPHALEVENARLRERITRAEAELAKARKVIEVQGNVSALLGELLEPRGAKPTEPGER